ncbi:hypothetical protein I4F81_008603 [Pyropia yezoensis]|uniref:Uncharacterized protein n=1 Tax=Pyropia yezoensis TaxID=2788 RepID=A0ACC3C878_PYRYE|nr:hypothetical protein I4F81_008603 [Neopyropia yezoensis]
MPGPVNGGGPGKGRRRGLPGPAVDQLGVLSMPQQQQQHCALRNKVVVGWPMTLFVADKPGDLMAGNAFVAKLTQTSSAKGGASSIKKAKRLNLLVTVATGGPTDYEDVAVGLLSAVLASPCLNVTVWLHGSSSSMRAERSRACTPPSIVETLS